MTTLMQWVGFDHTQPYPWGTVPCPSCEETELAIDVMRPPNGFVCMACGLQTTIEERAPTLLSDEILEFIWARLYEDERAANRARSDAGEHWPDGAVSVELGDDVDSDASFETRAVSEHVTRHDPARVLRGVQAKRRILERHRPVDPSEGYHHQGWLECAECGPNKQDTDVVAAPGNGEPTWFPCLTLRDVASEWSTHPNFLQEWRS